MKQKLSISVYSLHCENNAIRLINHSVQNALKVLSGFNVDTNW